MFSVSPESLHPTPTEHANISREKESPLFALPGSKMIKNHSTTACICGRIKKTCEGGLIIKHFADLVTYTRFLFAVGLVLAVPFSPIFWACYLCGGASDLLDGAIARRLNIQSSAGARLDSTADLVFAAAIAAFAVRSIRLPAWLWICCGCIAALRLAGYGIGLVKYRAFSALHTRANKATGALIFAFPLLYSALGLTVSGVILCAAGFFSSAEELIITLYSAGLDRDCKGILLMKHHGEAKCERA